MRKINIIFDALRKVNNVNGRRISILGHRRWLLVEQLWLRVCIFGSLKKANGN